MRYVYRMAVLFLLLLFWPYYSAQAYLIKFDEPLAGVNFYKTETTKKARYSRYQAGIVSIRGTNATDLNVTPTRLSALNHPIIGRPISQMDGKLSVASPLSVGLGCYAFSLEDCVDGLSVIGTGNQFFVINGTFRVVPGAGDPATGFVPLVATGLFEGRTRTMTQIFGPEAEADLTATIKIQYLGSAVASSNSRATSENGFKLEVSKEGPTVGVEAKVSKQQTGGLAPQPFSLDGKVPINEPILWTFVMSQAATNGSTFGGFSDAYTGLNVQEVNLSPQAAPHYKQRQDPFFSSSVFSFDSSTGELQIRHPLATVAMDQVPRDFPETGAPLPTPDYSGFLPEIQAILIEETGQFSESDGLFQSLLRYSGIFLDKKNPDGTFAFTDGLLNFLNPLDKNDILATANLTNILADPSADMFSAQVANFHFVSLSPTSSPLGLAFSEQGGDLWFDPDIIFDSHFFTESAMSAPYAVDGRPRVVPEPSALGLLTAGLIVFLVRYSWLRNRADAEGTHRGALSLPRGATNYRLPT
jgi:hypothetical protein